MDSSVIIEQLNGYWHKMKDNYPLNGFIMQDHILIIHLHFSYIKPFEFQKVILDCVAVAQASTLGCL